MKRLLLYSVSLFVVVACTRPGSQYPTYAPHEVVQNQFLFKGDAAPVEAELKAMGVEAELDPVRQETKTYRVRYSGQQSFNQIAEKLDGKVEWVEPNFKYSINAIESRYDWPTDKFFFYQYAINNIGQSAPWGLPGKNGADMKVLEAWKAAGTQGGEVVIAVIDSGVDYKHSELNQNMWVNEAEAPKNGGIAGRDEDGNGFFDDIHGFDFVSSNRVSRWYGKKGDADPMDDNGHGTHCAGAIAALNNHQGIVGVNPKAKIMALKALNGMGGGDGADIIEAVYYAVDKKADIISMSLGGLKKSRAAQDAYDYAKKQGVLLVIASGNDAKNIDIPGQEVYPASYDNDAIVTVGASDNQDNPAVFSNYGYKNVDVFAPGVNVLSTVPRQCKESGGTKVCEDKYSIMSGTSMATPYVAGVASLLMAADPSLKGNPQLVRQILIDSSDKVPALFGKAAANGRVNALAALQKASGEQKTLAWQTNDTVKFNQRRANDQLVDIRIPIEQEGATALRIHFDFLDIDDPYDSLYIYDKNWKLISEFKNGHSRDHWSPIVIGDKAYVRFVNSKIQRVGGDMQNIPMKMSDLSGCLNKGGENMGPVIKDEMTMTDQFLCSLDSMEVAYEDLKKGTDDPDIFFNFNSDGFSIDKIEYTQGEI